MNLFKGIRTRLVLVTAVCSFLVVLVSAALMVRSVFVSVIYKVAHSNHIFVESDEIACGANPSGWFKHKMADGVEVFAYDFETGKSLNPQAPPLDEELYEQLKEGERVAIMGTNVTPVIAKFAQRVAESGPCSVIQSGFRELPDVREQVKSSVLVAAFFAVFAIVGVLMLFFVRPVVQRLHSLANAARHVGEEDGYVSANDNLWDEIGDLSKVLDSAHKRMRSDAVALERRRVALENHLANVAHDLRTPMASMHLGLEGLREHLDGEGRGMIQRVLSDSVYLQGLTDNLHMASKLSDGMDPVAGDPRVDLADLVDRIALRFSLLGQTSNVAVVGARPDDPMWVCCDPFIAERAFSNIVHNAVTYAEDNGNIAIVLEQEEQGRFSLTISDDGPGVPPSELPRLAERTFRSDEARKRDPRGGGLGLAITNEICQRAGWVLNFEALEPRGLGVRIEGNLVGPPQA